MTIPEKTTNGNPSGDRRRRGRARRILTSLLVSATFLPLSLAGETLLPSDQRLEARSSSRISFHETILRITPSDLTRHPIAREARTALSQPTTETDLASFLDRIRSPSLRGPSTKRAAIYAVPRNAGHQPPVRWGTFSAEVSMRIGTMSSPYLDAERLRRWQRLRSVAAKPDVAEVALPASDAVLIDRLLRTFRTSSGAEEHPLNAFFD